MPAGDSVEEYEYGLCGKEEVLQATNTMDKFNITHPDVYLD
jgi:hypothetical protein